MSQPTWTAEELQSEARPSQGECWRVTESQFVVSTLKATNGDVEKQSRLDELIEGIKPTYPAECDDLHPLIKGSFRYPPWSNEDSRFRRKGQREGAYYASTHVNTAVAEKAFIKALFYAESPDTEPPENPMEHTAFRMEYRTERSLDLTKSPLNRDEKHWQHPTEYGPCQALADTARTTEIDVIQNKSVRCPNHGDNITVLRRRAFVTTGPDSTKYQTWRLLIQKKSVIAIREGIGSRYILTFKFEDWSFDERIAEYIKRK